MNYKKVIGIWCIGVALYHLTTISYSYLTGGEFDRAYRSDPLFYFAVFGILPLVIGSVLLGVATGTTVKSVSDFISDRILLIRTNSAMRTIGFFVVFVVGVYSLMRSRLLPGEIGLSGKRCFGGFVCYDSVLATAGTSLVALALIILFYRRQ